MQALTDFHFQVEECCEALSTKHRSQLAERELVSTTDHFRIRVNEAEKPDGARRMEEIIRLINSLPGYEPSYFQRMFIDEILQCVAPVVFRGCSAQDLSLFFLKMQWVMKRARMRFGQTSRRSGKTDSLTIVCAALMIVVPHVKIIAWSLYNDTSLLFGNTVAAWIRDLGYGDQMKHTTKGIRFYGDDATDVRILKFIGSQNPNVSLYFFFSFALPLFVSPCMHDSPHHTHAKKGR
jgi:hypothetical protein